MATGSIHGQFQFHIGAIRSKYLRPHYHYAILFQFHIGAIRRCNHEEATQAFMSFQFHIGAIRSFFFAVKKPREPCFNSILVQLEDRHLDHCKGADEIGRAHV